MQHLERGAHRLPGWSHIYAEDAEIFAELHSQVCKRHAAGRFYSKELLAQSLMDDERAAPDVELPSDSEGEDPAGDDATAISEACEVPIPESRKPLDVLPVSWTPHVQDKRHVALGKFLAIRLAYGSANIQRSVGGVQCASSSRSASSASASSTFRGGATACYDRHQR